MTTVHVEVWRDEHGVEWELVQMGLDVIGGSCVIRERSRLDEVDGDGSEGFQVIARFGDREAAEEFLVDEGFAPD